MRQSNKKLTVFIFCLFLVLGFLFSFKTLSLPLINGEADGYSRANWAFDNYIKGNLLTINKAGGSWLPFHIDILSFSILMTGDPKFGPRLISLFFCVFSVALMYLFTERMFEHEKNKRLMALTATSIYLFNPLRLLLATQPLSEAVSTFFFILILWLCSAKKIKHIYVILLINIACAIRFEFWMLIPFVWLIFYIKKPDKKWMEYIWKCLLCLVFPLYWMVLNYFHSGNYWEFFIEKYNNAQNNVPEVAYYSFVLAFEAWIKMLIYQIGMVGFLLYVSTWKFLRKWKNDLNKNKIFVLLPLYFLLLLILQVYFGTMEWLPPRYLFPVLISIIPFVGYGLIKIIEKILSQRNKVVVGALLIVAIFLVSKDIIGIDSNLSKWQKKGSSSYGEDALQLVDFFRLNQKKSENTFYVENGDWTLSMLVFLSQKHDIRIMPSSEYYLGNFEGSTNVILTNSFGNSQICLGKVIYTNKSFRVCSF